MFKFLGKLLKVYEDEINLFLWSSVLIFLIRSSAILFNNFAETAFLKRFGVEYLPLIYIINSLSTFWRSRISSSHVCGRTSRLSRPRSEI